MRAAGAEDERKGSHEHHRCMRMLRKQRAKRRLHDGARRRFATASPRFAQRSPRFANQSLRPLVAGT